MRVAYLVSRFPAVSETFVVRELAAVAAQPGVEVELRSLFPAGADGAIQPAAAPWVPGLRRPAPKAAVRALGFWARRRPAALARVLAEVVVAHARHPRLLWRALVTLALAAAHARELDAEAVDHVHAHFATYPALTAWAVHRLTGLPYSFTAHAHDIFVHQALLTAKVRDARFVVAISEYNQRLLQALDPRGEDATPIHVVHCGVVPDTYPYRRRCLPREGPLRAICVAGLRDYKGQHVLLEALASDDPRLARVELDLVGDGPRRAWLEGLAASLGIAERVTFHGSLPEPEVTRLLDRAHLFVAPSVVAPNGDMEGIPVALMEALAAGLPTVSTRQSGIPELVRHGETGLLAEPDDPRGLREALLAVLADPAGAERRAEAGRRLVEDAFDVRTSARTLAALFAARS